MQWKPHPGSQEIFHRLDTFEAFYGGAAGGGKSDSLLIEATRQMDKPNYQALLLRRTFPELEKSLILRSFELFTGKYEHQAGQRRWWNPATNSFIEFGHLENEKDVYNYHSARYDFIGFDELTTFTEFQYRYMMSRVRGTDPNIKRYVRAAGNPGNIGHVWVKDRFVDPTAPHIAKKPALKREFTYNRIVGYTPKKEPIMKPYTIKIWEEEVAPGVRLTRTFVPATVYDNPTLFLNDPMYIARLLALPEVERKRLLEGDWDVSAGQFFPEFNRETHIVDPFPIPTTWRKYRSIDFGRNAPFCALWFAVDYDGNVYVYREYYQAGYDADVNAQNIWELSRNEQYHYTVADASIFSKTGHGETIAQILARKGVNCIPSSKDRVAGWNVVHAYLRGTMGHPKLYIFRNCTNLIRTLPQLIHDEKNPEDLNTDGEDHGADALRYFLQTLRERKTPEPVLSELSEEIRRKAAEFNKKIGKVEQFNYNKFYEHT